MDRTALHSSFHGPGGERRPISATQISVSQENVGPIIDLQSLNFSEIKPRLAKQSLCKEGRMAQYAWLDFAFGVWHLVTENDHHPARYWKNKEAALGELAVEG